MSDGAALERRVERLLRAAGLHPRRRRSIRGARQADEFDIAVDVTSLGIDGLWVIECKDWDRNVDKGTVLTFLGRVTNTGADKGIVVTTTGYQSGCWDAIANTNIRLLTTHEFEEFIGEEIARAKLRLARSELRTLVDHLEAMHKYGNRVPGKPFRRGLDEHFPSGPQSEEYPERLRALRFLLEQLTLVLAGDDHYHFPDLEFEEDPDEYVPDDWYPTVTLNDVKTFASHVTAYVEECRDWAQDLTEPP